MNDQSLTRSFLACWPGASVHTALYHRAAQMRDQVGGRIIRPENLHVTLAFLGPLNSHQLEAVRQCCAPLPRRFEIELDRIGFFRKGGIVWAGSRSPDPELSRFVEDLRDCLRRLGFRVENRPFVPHITLLRKARRRPRSAAPQALHWLVDEYTLSASELGPDGARYSVLDRWSTLGDVK